MAATKTDTVKQHQLAEALAEALRSDPLTEGFGDSIVFWPMAEASRLGWAEAPTICWEGGPFEWAVALTGTDGKSLDSEYRAGSMRMGQTFQDAYAAVREAGFYCECPVSFMLAVYPV